MSKKNYIFAPDFVSLIITLTEMSDGADQVYEKIVQLKMPAPDGKIIFGLFGLTKIEY